MNLDRHLHGVKDRVPAILGRMKCKSSPTIRINTRESSRFGLAAVL